MVTDAFTADALAGAGVIAAVAGDKVVLFLALHKRFLS